MGKTRKHTVASKRTKRFNQKVRRKLFFKSRENEKESLQVDETCVNSVDTSVETVHGHASESTANNCDGNVLAASCNFSDFQTPDACTCLGEDMDVALMKTDDCFIEL